jgi:hypothetical protein
MEVETGIFAGFYASFLQHPLLLWIGALAAIAFCRFRRGIRPEVRFFCTALGLLALCDAWLTSNDVVGIGTLPESLATVVPLAFVLLGDFRFFLFLSAATEDGRLVFGAKRVAAAVAWTVVVPISNQVVLALLPTQSGRDSGRVMFLVYETLFVCLALALIRWHPRVRAQRWLWSVSWFVVLYYLLWASADAILLFAGLDVGFALRVLPNLLYYGGLIAFIAATAPRVAD